VIAPPVVCGFCAGEFAEDRGQPVCRACPLAGLCHMVRCPHCGYENPVPPAWLSRLLHQDEVR
jgi:predicted amidophosphoribosyltransferase